MIFKNAFLLICILFCSAGYSQVILLTKDDDFQAKIQAGRPGDTFYLAKGEYLVSSTVHIPTGVTIQGCGEETVLKQGLFLDEAFYFFQIDNGKDIVIKNLRMDLQDGAIGISTTNESFESDHISIQNLIFNGNLQTVESQNKQSSLAIYLKNVNSVEIFGCHITRTIGGIYVLNAENVYIRNNYLTQVALASINVQGRNLHIIKNITSESGKPTPLLFYGGDAVTIGDQSYDVEIEGNIFETGYCYIVAVGSGVNNLHITNNVISGGITVGMYIDNVINADIINNIFIFNRSYGLAFSGVTYNTVVRGNQFYGNAMYLKNSYNTFVDHNHFSESPLESSPLEVDGTVNASDNRVEYIAENQSPHLVIGIGNDFLSPGNEMVSIVNKLEVRVSLENRGDKAIKFLALPQVTLSSNAQAGTLDSHIAYVKPYHQPTRLALRSGEMTEFSLTLADLPSLEFYIIISTDMDPNPLWYKVKLINNRSAACAD